MFRWIRRNYVALAFVVVNLAIAAPVDAALDNATCLDPGGDITPCCTSCFIFCNCTL